MVNELYIIWLHRTPKGRKIYPPRLAGKSPKQDPGKRHDVALDKVLSRRVPGKLSIGHADQNVIYALAGDPILELFFDPRRGGGLRRGKQDEVARLIERGLDRRP